MICLPEVGYFPKVNGNYIRFSKLTGLLADVGGDFTYSDFGKTEQEARIEALQEENKDLKEQINRLKAQKQSTDAENFKSRFVFDEYKGLRSK